MSDSSSGKSLASYIALIVNSAFEAKRVQAAHRRAALLNCMDYDENTGEYTRVGRKIKFNDGSVTIYDMDFLPQHGMKLNLEIESHLKLVHWENHDLEYVKKGGYDDNDLCVEVAGSGCKDHADTLKVKLTLTETDEMIEPIARLQEYSIREMDKKVKRTVDEDDDIL